MPELNLSFILGHYNYFAAIALMMIGLYTIIRRPNLIKKIIGLNLFQNGVFLFYISIGMAANAQPPILLENSNYQYANPLPHVLILTAIVVGISTMAVALAITVRIGEAYGTIESTEIATLDRNHNNDNNEKENGNNGEPNPTTQAESIQAEKE